MTRIIIVFIYRVIKKSLCTWHMYCNHQVHRDFLITRYYSTEHNTNSSFGASTEYTLETMHKINWQKEAQLTGKCYFFFMCVIPVVCVTNKKGGVVKQHN